MPTTTTFEDLDIEEKQELARAIEDVMTMPPQMLAAPFETIRTVLGEQIEECTNPMIAELLYLKGLGSMGAYLRTYQHNMALFNRCEETQGAYELLKDCYPALIGSLGTELDLFGQVWDKMGFPSVLGNIAERNALKREAERLKAQSSMK
jgi:hypothetical protein